MFGEDEEWLKNLKIGDEVYISARYGGTPSRAEVSRITKSMVVIGHKNLGGIPYEERFNRETGASVGSDCWSRVFLIQPTDKIKERVLMANLIRKAQRFHKEMVIPRSKEAIIEFINTIVKYVPEKKENENED